MHLFNQKTLKQRIAHFDFPSGDKAKSIAMLIQNWQIALKDHDLERTKEKGVQGLFLQRFFEQILDYSSQVSGKEEWNLIQHPKSEVDAQEPDGSLGFFTNTSKVTRAIIELKDAKTLLDKKQTGREKGYTPIEQAYLYATKFDRCDWVIVSNFREIRLYNKQRTQDYYESFDVLDLHKDDEFKRFYYVLCRNNLISKIGSSIMDELAKDTTLEEENITTKFYQQYKQVRLNLLNHLIEQNSEVAKEVLLEKTQKILDRFIFMLFCEDTGNLLPRNIVNNTYQLGMLSRERSDERVWREFKNLFIDIDEGRDDIDPQINKYNGGLFAYDDVLNNLKIKDTAWQSLIELCTYDFESELNVNILGHIFEQSISDLENLKADLATTGDLEASKRKKEGIFYTPEYITEYMIKKTVGKYLEEHPDQLETITILDPACGSGGFLNQAHTFLSNTHKEKQEEHILEKNKKQLDFSDVNLVSVNRGILLNNLYGVDLNPESVEITKLSLWLKTAKATEPLQNLNNNIKCGNSLISDPEIAGHRAFNWDVEFKDIMDSGGFDVIIGNPPYVRQEFIKEVKPYLEANYKVYTGISDLYVYFFEKALQLLKEGGYFSFIVSNKFLRAGYGKKLMEYLQTNYSILELIDFGDLQIFEGATTYPCIITIKKQKPKEDQIVHYLKLQSLDNVTNLQLEVDQNATEITINRNDNSWKLQSPNNNALLTKLMQGTTPLGEYVDGKIFRGILTGFNDAFIIDEETRERLVRQDQKNKEIIKPLLRGLDIKRYKLSNPNLWVIIIESGWTNHNRDGQEPEEYFKTQYPYIYEHLKTTSTHTPRGKGLYDRDDKGDYWWELRPCAYYQEFEKPKIIYPNITKEPNFMLDIDKFYTNQKAFMIPINDKWLLGILNSSTSKFWFNMCLPKLRGGFFEPSKVFLKNFPIPQVSNQDKGFLEEEVVIMLNLQKTLQHELQQATEVLQSQYKLKKITKKLESFYSLGWNELIEELDNQRVELSLEQKEELNKWFRAKQKEVQDVQDQIQAIDNKIDEYVYSLYHLTPEEIAVIEGKV